MEYEYWDAYLKTQSKSRLNLFYEAVKKFNAEITDRYEQKYFKDKLAWRNPVYLKLRLPKNERGCTQRWNFILECKCQVILEKPPRIGIPDLNWNRYYRPLMGNHTALQYQKVRNYRIHPTNRAYVKDHVSGIVLEGSDNVLKVLNGELELLRK
jgi:hypothetical protein